MSSRGPLLSIILVGLIFVIGLLAVTHTRPSQAREFGLTLSELLPAGEGWERKKLSIAETPEVQAKVNELLNFTDAEFCEYTKGSRRIAIYMAYWEPGRMTIRDVASHTPDVCWTLAGWEKRASNTISKEEGGPWGMSLTEYRCFEANGRMEHVFFWHIVGDRIHSYKTGWRPPWYAAVSDVFAYGLEQKVEQLFVRVSANIPYEEMVRDDLINQFMEKLKVKAILKRPVETL